MQTEFQFLTPDEVGCIEWLWPGGDPLRYEGWWKGLPSIQRNEWLAGYALASLRGGQSFAAYTAAKNEHLAGCRRLAECWASQIRAAAKRGEPIPISPAPKFEAVFDWACELAGVLVAPAGQA